MITAGDRKTYLRSLFWDAQDRAVTFFSVLKASIRGQFQDSNNGRFVVATSGNGRSSQFYMPDWTKTLTADDVRNLFSFLFDLYIESYKWNVKNATAGFPAQANAFPIVDSNISPAMEQTIFDWMIESKWMQRITESFPDWSDFYLSQLNFCARYEGVICW